ncbi:MAG TPA: VOC family protein [Spongiibacteraceae bacterium]|jgi:catechol 2,3-dioxygenase-like lactoylglutathione lyase family enzyme
MNGTRPSTSTAGLRHIALFIERFDEAVYFYTELLGMTVEWHPDADNIYLTSGNDNLAIHRFHGGAREPAQQRLDHIGFIIDAPAQVDAWFEFLSANGVRILKPPKTHRDGARSFYCLDPDGNAVQMIYHPPISALQFTR